MSHVATLAALLPLTPPLPLLLLLPECPPSLSSREFPSLSIKAPPPLSQLRGQRGDVGVGSSQPQPLEILTIYIYEYDDDDVYPRETPPHTG